MKVENTNKKGYWLIEFDDEFCGVAIYEKSLDATIRTVARIDRPVKSIEWIDEK